MRYILNKSIFPVIALVEDSNGNPISGKFLGNCFYCNLGNNLAFITAKHILGNIENKNNKTALIYLNKGVPNIIRINAINTENTLCDFSFFLPFGSFRDFALKECVALRPYAKTLAEGQDVVTYGFPLSRNEIDVNKKDILEIRQLLFRGYVQACWNEGRPGQSNQIYALSFPSIPGLSGSPLLAGEEGELKVAGILYEHHSLSRQMIIEDIESENGKEHITREYINYEIGIATNHEPFEQITQLLLKVTRELEDRNKSKSQ
jgi:hypothetical protein